MAKVLLISQILVVFITYINLFPLLIFPLFFKKFWEGGLQTKSEAWGLVTHLNTSLTMDAPVVLPVMNYKLSARQNWPKVPSPNHRLSIHENMEHSSSSRGCESRNCLWGR